MDNNICQRCGATILSYEKTIHLQSKPMAEIICSECFSKEMAMLSEMQLAEFTPQTVEINGRGRKKHLFYIDRMVFPMGISLEATEIEQGEPKGYKTAVHGDLDCDQAELLEKLLKKSKRVVSRKYIEVRQVGWEKKNCIKEKEVAGRIEWDEDYEGRLPLVIIDGKKFSWDELGEMVMSFEGWDFKLKIFESWEDEE